jgi:hypothetical protein
LFSYEQSVFGSGHVVTAVHGQSRTSHEAWMSKQDATRDLWGFIGAPHRDEQRDCLFDPLDRHRANHVGGDMTWPDRVETRRRALALICVHWGRAA